MITSCRHLTEFPKGQPHQWHQRAHQQRHQLLPGRHFWDPDTEPGEPGLAEVRASRWPQPQPHQAGDGDIRTGLQKRVQPMHPAHWKEQETKHSSCQTRGDCSSPRSLCRKPCQSTRRWVVITSNPGIFFRHFYRDGCWWSCQNIDFFCHFFLLLKKFLVLSFQILAIKFKS